MTKELKKYKKRKVEEFKREFLSDSPQSEYKVEFIKKMVEELGSCLGETVKEISIIDALNGKEDK